MLNESSNLENRSNLQKQSYLFSGITIFDRYFILTWFKHLFIVVILASSIILLIDFIDLSKAKDNGLLIALQLAALKNYHTIYIINPFIVLIATISSYFSISSKREVMAIFSLGYSHFLALKPGLIAVLLYYILSVSLLNVIDSFLLQKYQELEMTYFNKSKSFIYLNNSGLWFKQDIKKYTSVIDNSEPFFEKSNTLIINALKISQSSDSLFQVRIFFLDNKGNFIGKILSPKITLKNKIWRAEEGLIFTSDGTKDSRTNLTIPITLSIENITSSMVTPEILGLWKLTNFIKTASEMGLPILIYQSYLSKSLFAIILYLALVIISYSLTAYVPRISKPSIISALLIGFIIYFTLELSLLMSLNKGITPLLVCSLIYGICFLFATYILYLKCLNYQKLRI